VVHAATHHEALRSIGVCIEAGIGLAVELRYRCGGSGGLAGAYHTSLQITPSLLLRGDLTNAGLTL